MDAGSYLHLLSQYHARPKAKRGIAMLSDDKFPYPRKQTRCNKSILCSNYVCQILKSFRSFKISDTPFTWPKSLYKHSVAPSHRSGKESCRWSWSPMWRHQWHSFLITFHADNVKLEIRVYTSWLLANQKRESTPSMGWISIFTTFMDMTSWYVFIIHHIYIWIMMNTFFHGIFKGIGP